MAIGANHLGLDISWDYRFVPNGARADTTRSTVYLDVGGKCCPGVLDQHQGVSAACTAELVVGFPEYVRAHLLNHWEDLADQGHSLQGRKVTFTLVSHSNPDFDAVVSVWLCQRLVETGSLPPEAEALAAYAALVDQGKYQVHDQHGHEQLLAAITHAVHTAFLMAQWDEPNGQVIVKKGVQLIEGLIQSVRAAQPSPMPIKVQHLLPRAYNASNQTSDATDPVTSWMRDPAFRAVAQQLSDDLHHFLNTDLPNAEAFARSNPRLAAITLPSHDGGAPIEVRAFVLPEPSKSKLQKYWFRAKGWPFSAIPVKKPGTTDLSIIFSLDPTYRTLDGRAPTLKGLGLRLEQAEAQRRAANPTHQRGQPPRYNDGSCDNADPWYDGRDHAYTIIGSPNCGSKLSLSEVLSIAWSRFWEVRLTSALITVLLPLDRPRTGQVKQPLHTSTLDDHFSKTLTSYLEAIQISPLTVTPEFPVLDQMELTQSSFRSLKDQSSGTFDSYEFRLSPHSKPDTFLTAEALAQWMAAIQRCTRHRAYVVSMLTFEAEAHLFSNTSRLLMQLVGTSEAAAQLGGGDLILYNGHTLALQPAAADTRVPMAVYRELLCYVAFQAETLDEHARHVADLVHQNQTARTQKVRQEFLTFHTRYVFADVTHSRELATIYTGLREALHLDQRQNKAMEELDRLSEIEETRAERKVAFLLAVVGLSGVVQACTINFGDVATLQLWMTGIFSLSMLGILFWLYYRRA